MITLEEKFLVFNRANPDVLQNMVYFARQWRERRGHAAQIGVCNLLERVRWEVDSPRISNNHKPFYARYIMDNYPDLDGIFELRKQLVQTSFGPKNKDLK